MSNTVENHLANRILRDSITVLIGIAIGVIASVVLSMTGFTIVPYREPEATGAVIVLPNADDLDVQLRGPAPGFEYVHAPR